MYWSGGILGRYDPVEEALPLSVAARFLPPVLEGSGLPSR
jgi:hypothetical protein